MFSRRYFLTLANRDTGTKRRLHLRVDAVVCAFVIALLVGGGVMVRYLLMSVALLGSLELNNARLELENAGYRGLAVELTDQTVTLERSILELSKRTDIDPSIAESMENLPKFVQARGLVDTVGGTTPLRELTQLQDVLGSLRTELERVRRGVAYREALADATPVLWPADGWISAGYGYRDDPFTGEQDFHHAVDISTAKGRPVYATATGRVLSAGHKGPYGNLIEIDHGFGLTTRYGHLSKFIVAVGSTVQRGDVIGSVGATGRATGYHVHYEVWSDDRALNPMRLLARPRQFSAN